MSIFFPPALITKRRGEIIVFKKGEDESLYTTWERFQETTEEVPYAWD